jgi:two-component system chemotaxis sensor kinase CheA
LPSGWPSRQQTAQTATGVQDSTTLLAVLDGQRRLLGAGGSNELWPGRLAAATRAIRGVLRYAGRDDVLAELDAAHAQAELAGGAAALLAFIGGLVSQSASQSQPAAPAAVAERDQFAAGDARGGAAQTLRVEQHRVDALMKLIGELVVAKNALAYLARQAEDGALGVRELAREIKDRQALVNRIAEEMQAAVMAVRMLPVDHVFQRFPRLVRDTARRLGKRVELVVEGGETEADKNVIEALADPLIHMVRNSLDHGIEQPADRLAAGKAEQGTIRLLAMQDNDNVVIRIADDGRGIDPAIVKRKAVEKGLLDADRAAAISDADAIQLVFLPGFSTAAAISDLSGRGVGMDVVRSAVEKAGGRVSLDSCKGQGTRVEVTLPLSMSVTRIMTVALGSRLFGVPMPLVVETVRIPRTALRMVRDREIFVLRDSVVPVVRLARLLNLPDEDRGADEQAVLVVRLNGERLGIVVGAFREGMEVIVKPMEGVLAGLRGFSGTTLLGDGRVLLILDLRELVD